jgi:bis(5'-nucleosyl)-tetraphosphatase (symmetrical)
LDELRALRSKLKIKEEDREFCVGDLLNKGPKSVELLRYVKSEGILCVRGNHEDKFIRYHHHQKNGNNPMRLNALEQEIYDRLNEEDFVFLESLPLYRMFGELCILHAGVLPTTRLEKLDKKAAAQIMRVRYVDETGRFVHLENTDPAKHFFWSELYDGRYGYIVYGHQPFLKPRVDRFSFGIDTGAVYGNELSAVVFEDGVVANYSFVSLKTRAYAKKERLWEPGDL